MRSRHKPKGETERALNILLRDKVIVRGDDLKWPHNLNRMTIKWLINQGYAVATRKNKKGQVMRIEFQVPPYSRYINK